MCILNKPFPVARHASERYSSSKVFLAVAFLMQTVFGFDFGLANLISTLLLELPNSRTQEYEGVFHVV
jgi:hypothetical protein